MKNHTAAVLVACLSVVVLVAAVPAANAQGVLFVKNDKVGIGTDNPSDPLHVKSDVAGSKTIARYTNNGAPFVQYEDTSLGISWGLQPTGIGDFTITLNGSGGPEFLITKTGQVRIGPGSSTQFNLTPSGNLTISGTLTENSNREMKEGFAKLDEREILEQVVGLDVLEWRYKNQSARHIGPMAQDFYAAFGLGSNDKSLAPRDVAGVALVALQGLHKVVEEKDRHLEQLQQELSELRSTVKQLLDGNK